MKPIVKQAENEQEIPAEILAQSVKKISECFKRLKKSGLSERAIVVLLNDASGVSKVQIRAVLRASEDLEKMYLKK